MNTAALNAPTAQPDAAPVPALTPDQLAAQAVVDAGDIKTMLHGCLPLLRAEVLAAEFMLAEATKSRDVQVRKRRFLKAAGKIDGLLPQFTDCALRIIAGPKKG